MTVRRAATASAWFVVLAGGLVLLWFARIPAAGGVEMGFALIRLAGLAAGTYLLAISTLRAFAAAVRREWFDRIVHRMSVGAVRGLLDIVMGTSVLLAVAGGPAVADEGNGGDPPILRHLEDNATAPAPVATAEAAERPPGTWTVRPGEHFWSIAEQAMTDALGRRPTDSETARYWLDLIEANRGRLVHASLPDLIYPGQEFVLPPTP